MTTKVLKWTMGLVGLAAGWLSVLALVMWGSDQAPGALVPLPSDAFLGALPKDVAILSHNAFSITLASDGPGIAARLYDAGAWLVLPSGLPGCAPRV